MDNIHGSIDSCQNKVSADPYHLTVLRAQVSTYRGRVLSWVGTSYRIPIVYRYIDSYSAVFLVVYRGTWLASVSWPTSRVPRYLAYLGTLLAPVSWPTCVSWIA